MKSLLRYLVLLWFLICLQVGEAKATTYAWKGGSALLTGPNDWNNKNNWSPVGIPTSSDPVTIGTTLSFVSQPMVLLGGTATCASIAFGSMAPLVTTGTLQIKTSILTVNGSLNLGTGAITLLSTIFVDYSAILAGSGSLICGSVQISSTSLLSSVLQIANYKLTSTLSDFHITGDIAVNSTSIGLLLGLGVVNGYFSLQGGVTTIDGTILTQNTTILIAAPGTPIFSIDPPAGSTATLNLTNTNAINTTAASGSTIAGYIDFYNNIVAGTSTVNYSGVNQNIYTNAPANLKTDPQTYQNLILSGTGTKTINNGTLTVANNFTTLTTTPGTTSTAVLFNTNNPTTTIGGNWTSNAGTTITGSTGTTTISGKLSNAGTINMAAGNLTIGSNYDNSGTFVQAALKSDPTTGTPTNTTFFTATTPILNGGTTGNSTSFNNVVFNGGASLTGTGSFSVSSVGVLQMKTASTSLAAGNGLLTLKSDASGSASVAPLPTGATITGNVNVQRFAVGGAGRRNYRLLSSPVNQSLITTGVPSYGFTDLQATTMISGYGAVGAYSGSATPTANSFDLTPLGNPSVFFYYEPDADPLERLISKSDYKGLNSINERFPIGNGFLFFFRGDRTINGANGVLKTSTTSTPQNTTMNFLGALNQGTINVNIPTNPTSTVNGNIVYITPTTAVSPIFSFTPHTPTTNDGLHLVGNPYACAIDLEGIILTNSSTNIYMLNNAGTFGVYQKGSLSTSLNNGVGRFVLSGQGFFIQGNASGAKISFSETGKATTFSPALVPTTFAVAKPRTFAVSKTQINDIQQSNAVPTAPTPHIMGISLTLDSVNNNETTIQFGEKTAKNSFDRQEDAYYMSGPAQTTFLASYTKDKQPCLINHMGGLDSIKTIPLYVEGQKDGLYTLKFTGTSSIDQRYKFYLVDNFKKDSLDLSANDTYNFNIQRANTQTYGASRFMLVRHDSGLHYSLLTFNGAKQNNTVALNWKTKYEGDYTNFVLQRSTDEGKNYSIIDSLQANGSGTYTFIDSKPIIGTNQYRLVQNIGADASKLSNIVAIDFLLPGLSKFKLYPNPADNIIKIDIGIPNDNTLLNENTLLTVKIYNINGRLVNDIKTTASKTLSQDVSQLPRGTYILKVTGNNDKLYGTKTFIKL